MSERIETLAGQVEWGAKNLAYNLDFIADPQLSFKPAPAANSALEIVGHLVMAYNGIGATIQAALTNQQPPTNPPQPPVFLTRDEAKNGVIAAAQNFAGIIRSIPDQRLNETVEMGFGTFPLSFVAGMGAIDTLHHHGQIAYLQLIFGDTESHFDMALFDK